MPRMGRKVMNSLRVSPKTYVKFEKFQCLSAFQVSVGKKKNYLKVFNRYIMQIFISDNSYQKLKFFQRLRIAERQFWVYLLMPLGRISIGLLSNLRYIFRIELKTLTACYLFDIITFIHI